MIIVEQGKVVDICAESGEFVYDTSTEPSIFYGSLGEGIKKSFAEIGKRFTFGGDTGKDQRVYFFNTKEIMGNKYGTPSPVPFRVVDQNIGLDMDISIRCHGEYSYKITNPMLFYTNVCGNLYEMGQQKPQGWACSCGASGNTGKFCMECGKPKDEGWTCSCGNINKGKFCAECGDKFDENDKI